MTKRDAHTDLLDHGQWVEAHITGAFEVAGRTISNLEMAAAIAFRQATVNERIQANGCCGGQMSDSGRCPETGRTCPLYLTAERLQRRVFQTTE
jgi:hypothetical protein